MLVTNVTNVTNITQVLNYEIQALTIYCLPNYRRLTIIQPG